MEINVEHDYLPFSHQVVVHKAISSHINIYDRFTDEFQKIFIVKAMRQVGKSMLAINELLRWSCTFNNCINGYIAPTQSLSRKTFKELIKAIPTEIVKKSNMLDLVIEFVNGSSIRFFSAAQREALRGFTISGLLVIDEAAYITDDIYNECISPWTDFYKAVTLVISTPRFKFGFFYDLYTSNSENIKSFDFSTFDMTNIRSIEKLEEKRKTMPKQQFNCEYLGQWADGVGNVFSNFTYLSYTPQYTELYLGLDFGTGSGQDSTVLTGLNENGDQVLIWETNSLDPVKQVDEITNILQTNKTKIKKFNAEKNSIGKIYLDMLKKKNTNIHISDFNTDNESKRKLVENLQVSFEQNRIRLLQHETQSTQLSFYEATVNKSTNKVSYNSAKGFHDDYVMALMLANNSYVNRFNNYRFTIV